MVNPTRDLEREVTFKQVLQSIPDREQHEQRPRSVSVTDTLWELPSWCDSPEHMMR